ncbi:MFS transporter, partial [Cutibacterium acnes]
MNHAQRNILLGVLITTFLAAIEVTIVSTAMPTIMKDLGGFELMSWVFAVYLLTSAVSVPIWGKLSDLYGRKKLFYIGVSVFLVGSTLCAFAQTMEQLIAFRFLQGIGAGAANTLSFAIVADAFNYEERARAQGWLSSVWGVAGIFGPLVGGVLVDYLSWQWIFLLNIP